MVNLNRKSESGLKNSWEILDHAFKEGIGAFNIGRYPNGRWQVSVRDNKSDGWQIYYGDDIEEVAIRAATGGSQLPVAVPKRRRHAALPWDAPR